MTQRSIGTSLLALALAAAMTFAQPPLRPVDPGSLPGISYDAEFFPGATHDPAVPTPDSILGFRLGERPVTHAQIEQVCHAIDEASPRVRRFDYATSHQGKTLFYLVIGSERDINRLDEIKQKSTNLADPRLVSAGMTGLKSIAESIPAIAWMSYVIHGDELSGSDAALALTYHLAACTDQSVTALLDKVLVIIDPDMNPDGRDRCVLAVHQNRTAQPSVDDQSLIHTGIWPTGRMNHYLFDMNRDWIFCTQPETIGRVRAINEWQPHYFMESHEMGPLDTFLFMPPREPVNPNIPPHVRKWEATFAQEQGAAFDSRAWRYYTGEWNEGWYPGYSGSWAAMRGIVDNLYEQATIVSDAVRRPEGTLETYRESVHKQLVSSIANLESLARHRDELLSDYAESRFRAVDNLHGEQRLFIITVPEGNTGRLARLTELINLQGIEVITADADFTLSGKNWLGRPFADRTFPKGTIVIPSRQPLSGLACTLFETDPRMPDAFLTEERRELLRFGRSRLYDITGWNIPMLFGVEVSEAVAAPPSGTRGTIARPAEPSADSAEGPPPVAWYLDARDDRSVAAAARLLERGVKVRALDKPTILDGNPVARGSFIITKKDNQDFAGDLSTTLTDAATLFGLAAVPIRSGMGQGDAPDLGGEHYVLLETPRIALLTRDPFNPYSVGELWHLLDHEMGIRAAYLDSAQLSGMDLRRYNVLIIPGTYGGTDRLSPFIPAIRAWVESGGTLIAIGESGAMFCKEKDGIGSTRLLPDVLTKLEDYRAAIVRDYLGKNTSADTEKVWSHTAPDTVEYPWILGDADKPSDEEAKRRDDYRALFTPQGAILAARTDDRHWLTAGCADILPVLVGSGPVLIPKHGGNAPVLLGVFSPGAPPPPVDADKQDDKERKKPAPGWLIAPPGHELRLRMSGLLWPEAADRLAHSAHITQERIGNGQVILFRENPNFRGASRGTARILMNAAVCGPGMGASHPIRP